MPQIEVEFALDANGILTVTATDKKTSKKADIKITNSGGLSKDEIDRMKRDAEVHAAEDKARRELVDLKNRGDAMIIQTRKSLEEHGAKVPPDVRGKIESAMSDLESKLKADEKGPIEASMAELEKATMELGKIVYEAEAAKAGAAPDVEVKPGDSKKDDVIDAEFKVKDE